MSNPEVISEEPITLSELKEQLLAIQQRDGELSFRSGKTLDHLQHLTLVDSETRERLITAIKDLNVPRLKDIHICKLIDLMPKTLKELNVIMSGYSLTINKDYQQKILDVLNS